MSETTQATAPNANEYLFSFAEVASHLQISHAQLSEWNSRFGHLLAGDMTGAQPRYSNADVAVLMSIQRLLTLGLDDSEIHNQLTPKRLPIPNLSTEIDHAALAQEETALANLTTGGVPQVVADLLGTIASSQQTVLNSQGAVREVVNVMVQDNFNLKEENRRLRDRVLEVERTFAEYQRREETRKERLESRVRALENTVTALQQQLAQVVQVMRQQQQARQPQRRGWFG
jgi:regulator of replication initiation timing